jgi:hypothetical protein
MKPNPNNCVSSCFKVWTLILKTCFIKHINVKLKPSLTPSPHPLHPDCDPEIIKYALLYNTEIKSIDLRKKDNEKNLSSSDKRIKESQNTMHQIKGLECNVHRG